MRRRTIAFTATVLGMLSLVIAAGQWLSLACFPVNAHEFKWQCELVLPALGMSFLLPSALYGYIAMRSPWIEGFSSSAIAALIATAMSYFHPFFGGSNWIVNTTATTYYAIFPGVIGALAGFKLRAVFRAGAAHEVPHN